MAKAGSAKDGLKLLPQTHSQFANKEYWDDFFNKLREQPAPQDGKTGAFEWYGTWPDLKRAVESALGAPCPDALVVGCGNSTLSEDMHADGFPKVTSVDFSPVVIKEMAKRAEGKPGLEYLEMDMLNMTAEWEGRFGAVFDKGALDALVSENNDECLAKGKAMIAEVLRVLKPGGTYFCVTLAQAHILRLLFTELDPAAGYAVEVHPFEPKSGSLLLPFLFAVRKAAAEPSLKVFVHPEKAEVVTEGAQKAIELMEDKRLVYHMQQKLRVGGTEGLVGAFALWSPTSKSDSPRFRVSVVDSGLPTKRVKLGCGVFLVPQGREAEWAFTSEEGQLKIAKGNGIGRLVVVSLGRDHEFESMEKVQEELSPSMAPLAPIGLKGPIPFMTVGSSLGSRTAVHKVESELSGPLVVEDVEATNDLTGQPVQHRRLVFMRSEDVLQSEARLISASKLAKRSGGKGKGKKGGKGKGQNKKKATGAAPSGMCVDSRFLAFEFHRAMVASLFLAAPNSKAKDSAAARFLVVGLGSGALSRYLAEQVPWFAATTHVDVVELDPAVKQVAAECFDFTEGDRMDVHLEEGTAFLRKRIEAAGERFDAVFLDVDAKDLTQPVLFPPVSFLDQCLLEGVRDTLLEPDRGMLVLNLACKSTARQEEILAQLRATFPLVLGVPLANIGDANCVVIASRHEVADGAALTSFVQGARRKAMAAASHFNDGRPCTAFPHDFEDECLAQLHSVDASGKLARV